MSNFRSRSILALPPERYGQPKGAFWAGTKELDRFPPTYSHGDDVFEEYLQNKSLAPNKNHHKLMNSSGLLELHYDTMRKRQLERSKAPSFIHSPTMDRPFAACANYGGHIPGKVACNVVGCSWQQGSRISHEIRGKHFDPPGSGVTYSLSNAGLSTRGLKTTSSLPDLGATGGSDFGAPNPWLNRDKRLAGSSSMRPLPLDKVARSTA